ncbi:MAG: hypothetical protein HFJ43_01755 [Clostridia bacterium]|nr:hypothetical protein [Clostridia bacterium]
MEKILKVNGIDCANCAAKIESKISKIKKVSDASVNFMTGKVMIETETEDEKEINNILEEVIKIINKIEPDATIE